MCRDSSSRVSIADFRDIGGLHTAGGKAVRSKRVYRSGSIDDPTPDDLKRLSQLRIRTVVCLSKTPDSDGHPLAARMYYYPNLP